MMGNLEAYKQQRWYEE